MKPRPEQVNPLQHIGAIAAAMSANMLGGYSNWKAVAPDSESNHYGVIDGGPGYRFIFSTAWPEQNRLSIRGCFTRLGRGNQNADFGPYNYKGKSITVDPKRGAEAIAKDIERRIWLEYYEAFCKAHEIQRDFRERVARLHTSIGIVMEIVPKPRSYGGATYEPSLTADLPTKWYGDGLELDLYDQRKEIKCHVVSDDQLRQVLTLLQSFKRDT